MLLIDFKDETRPLIQVRTWQPIKDKQGNIEFFAKKMPSMWEALCHREWNNNTNITI